MFSLLMFCAFTVSTAVPFELYFAPDQILPVTYIDEPIIISVSGPPNTTFEIEITVTKSDGEIVAQLKPTKPITYMNGKYWISINTLPPVRDFFITAVSLKYQGEVKEWQFPFCRIDRNIDKQMPIPFALYNPDKVGLHLAQMLGIKEISFNSSFQGLDELIKKAVSLGFKITLVFNLDEHSSPLDIFEDLNNRLGGYISVWEIEGNYSPEQVKKIFEMIRKSKGIGGFRPAFASIEPIPDILSLTSTEAFQGITWHGPFLSREDFNLLKDEIIKYGGEGIDLALRFNKENIPSDPVEQIQKVWSAKSYGVDTIILPYSVLVQDGKISQLVSFLSGTTRLWAEKIEPLGWYVQSDTINAFVFQTLTHWAMIFWGTVPLTLSGEGLATTQFFDSYGNPSTLPQVNENILTIDAVSTPQYLLGNSYNILYTTAVNEINTLANELNSEKFSAIRTHAITEAIKAISQNPKDSQNRSYVLDLFRELPLLEQIPINTYETEAQKNLFIAKLSKFLQYVCITEQFRGEPFREPLLDIVARSEEKLTEYLTGSSSASETDHRANWILTEVHRLIEKASKTTSNGKRIEATGLAYLAESRAQSLEYLNHSPLTMMTEKKISTPTPSAPTQKEELAKPTSPTIAAKLPEGEKKEIIEVSGPIEHTVKRGETIDSICKLYGITEDEFCSWNGVRKGAKLKTGKIYKIHVVRTKTPSETKPSSPISIASVGEGNEYVVQAGDYPGLIAKKLGVSTSDLLKVNGLTAKSILRIGQKLKIPGSKPSEETKPAEVSSTQETAHAIRQEATSTTPEILPEKIATEEIKTEEVQTYKLNPGDTPATVANKFGIPVKTLMEFNDIKDPTKLRAGRELKIPTAKISAKSKAEELEKPKEITPEEKPQTATQTKEETTGATVHIVSKGDNPYTISKKYDIPLDVLLQANQLDSKSVLQIGQKLIIPSAKKKE